MAVDSVVFSSDKTIRRRAVLTRIAWRVQEGVEDVADDSALERVRSVAQVINALVQYSAHVDTVRERVNHQHYRHHHRHLNLPPHMHKHSHERVNRRRDAVHRSCERAVQGVQSRVDVVDLSVHCLQNCGHIAHPARARGSFL